MPRRSGSTCDWRCYRWDVGPLPLHPCSGTTSRVTAASMARTTFDSRSTAPASNSRSCSRAVSGGAGSSHRPVPSLRSLSAPKSVVADPPKPGLRARSPTCPGRCSTVVAGALVRTAPPTGEPGSSIVIASVPRRLDGHGRTGRFRIPPMPKTVSSAHPARISAVSGSRYHGQGPSRSSSEGVFGLALTKP